MTLGFDWMWDVLWIAWGGRHRSGKESQTDCATAALQRKRQGNNKSRFHRFGREWRREKTESREGG